MSASTGRAELDVGPAVREVFSGRAVSEKRPLEDVVGEITGDFLQPRRMTEDGEVARGRDLLLLRPREAITGQHLLVNAGELMR